MSTDSNIEASEASEAAAKEAADEAVRQARQFSRQLAGTLSGLDRDRKIYLAALGLVVICTLIFDMASFSVRADHAVSETTAEAQRIAEAKLNSWSYSAFTSCFWGKLMWLSALAGIASLVYGAVTKSAAAWIPLSQIGFAGFATLLMMLIFLVGFPDLSAFDDAFSSATLLGYWLPLAACVAATVVAARRLL